MCFYHDDYDWIAQVSEEDELVATKPTKCAECRRVVQVGDTLDHIFMQQYEECRTCYDGTCECEDGKCCQCPEPRFGETSNYYRCEECSKFLDAVQEAEQEAGCNYTEARPGLETMIDDIRGGGIDEAKRYWKAAAKLSPELVRSGYLGWLWRRMFT